MIIGIMPDQLYILLALRGGKMKDNKLYKSIINYK